MITVSAKKYEDCDDCLTAAADDYIRQHPEFDGWDLAPKWGDHQRETITLDVPHIPTDADFDAAFERLGGTKYHDADGNIIGVVYRDDGTRKYYAADMDDISALVAYMTGTPEERRDAYSLWCADTTATEYDSENDAAQGAGFVE